LKTHSAALRRRDLSPGKRRHERDGEHGRRHCCFSC
jgi:hypothetical protein